MVPPIDRLGKIRRRAIPLLVATGLAVTGADAAAQSVRPGPPGPFAIDVRGVTAALPQAFGFYPDLPLETLVPARGFGIEAGGNVYFGRLGPARMGAGASVFVVRGTSDSAVATLRMLSPQFSLNFGTSRGWSYVSGGVGLADVRGRYKPADATRRSTAMTVLNVGGGARWFVSAHVAFTFDVRLHRLATQEASPGRPGTPATLLASAAVGLSFK